jgi:hypothetical protein
MRRGFLLRKKDEAELRLYKKAGGVPIWFLINAEALRGRQLP